MALDLYVGPLSRYHAGEWKNAGQQMAESQGLEYHIITPSEEEDEEPVSIEEVVEAVEQWQGHLRQVLEKAGESGELWADTAEADYATDRPGWPGWIAAILKYAHLLHPQFPEPEQVPMADSLESDPAYQEANKAPGLFQVLSLCELWLPGGFEFMFHGATVTGKPVLISSVELLNSALDEFCHLWGENRAQLETTGTHQPADDGNFDGAALHGLAVFCRMASEARRLSLPMILDY